MNKQKYRLLRIMIPLIIFLLGCPPPQPAPPMIIEEGFMSNVALTLLGQVFYLAPESVGSFLVQVRDVNTDAPLANSRVTITLGTPGGETREIFVGETDADGLVNVTFDVPAESPHPNQQLTILADTELGQVTYSEDVYVGRVYNVMLTSDKPVYQPGQTIHIRSLALETTNLRAAQGEPLIITVQDPAGNKLARQELTTSDYGVAATDFILDSQASSGDYIITAEMGPVSSSRSVEVKPYTLPRFEITLQSEQNFYLPGDTARGTVDAQYFFGKAVTGGQVIIEGFATDVEQVKVFELTGETDEQGLYAYEFNIPDYFVGQLENSTAQVDLKITVIDRANHSESVDESITVAEKQILVKAVPESGFLRPGLENIIYLQSSYPDGRSAQTTLTVTMPDANDPLIIETDEFGLATMTITPEAARDVELSIMARDANGLAAEQALTLGATGSTHALLLRPDKAQYQIGETMNVDIYVAGTATTAYLDIIKGQQTFGLAALPVENGVARAALDVDGSLLGTLELNAYVIASGGTEGDGPRTGEIVRDRRFVLANTAPGRVDIQADAAVYRPGDTATLEITATRDGAAMPGVVGISIVDESVFSVGAQDPGFARTYFLLERELLEPRYEIHDFSPLHSDDPSPYDGGRDSIRTTARADNDEMFGVSSLDSPAVPSQEVALFGLFAEELAATPDVAAEPLATVHNSQVAIHDSQFAFAYGWATRAFLAAPLLGLALYNGSRRRRHLLIGLILFSLAGFGWSACAAPAAAPAMGDMAASAAESAAEPALVQQAAPGEETTATRGQSQPPRLRQFFPETLYWLPELATDADGRARIEVPIADSITTWRVSVLASDQAGNLGSAQVGLRVFQDFFVEPDLPRFLTVGDELDVPVSVFNYLDEAQSIELTLAPADWFELRDGNQTRLTLDVGPNEVTALYIPIRVTGFGLNDFELTASGSTMSDAVLRQVEVLPDGQRQSAVESGRLAGNLATNVTIPPSAVPGTGRLTVKLYPGIVSQIVEGLEGMLQTPYGCFEQTSSTTYPNILVLDYLKTTGQINPRIQLQAEQYIGLGYQRLLSFETETPGGFSLFGESPAQTMLTAYGLMEFSDMSQVSYVDPALIERTAGFLFSRQNGDGSWDPQGMTIESGVERIGEGNLPATAYIAWALADAGYAGSESVQRALDYVQAHSGAMVAQPGSSSQQFNSPLATPPQDPYALALIANALIAGQRDATALLDTLIAQAETGPGGTLFWQTGLNTWMDSSGDVAAIETTALIATSLLRTNHRPDVAQQTVDYLVGRRDSLGSFYSTQATVLALKALLLAAESGGGSGEATITITLDNGETQTLSISDENADVTQQVSFTELATGNHALAISVSGQRALQYQVVNEYYVPWSDEAQQAEESPSMRVDVGYDRTELAINDVVNVTVEVELLAPGVAGTILVDLGIPPGFSPMTADLDSLVQNGLIDRYELTGRQIILYLTDVPSGQVYTFTYGLQARFPISAQTPSSTVFDYYTPDQRDTDTPQRIVVKLGTAGQ